MNQKGFTLIELLVSMGIVAVLTGMAVFNFNQSRIRARDVQRKNDLSQLQKALEIYRNDNNGKYPDIVPSFQETLLNDSYIKTEFVDPKGSEWARYQYKPDASLKSYDLMSCLENTADSVRASSEKCLQFPNNQGSGAECVCGVANTGVMYVLSNP
jgi:prepilin-type N-terminal cleavage/methylation domain-containing protein